MNLEFSTLNLDFRVANLQFSTLNLQFSTLSLDLKSKTLNSLSDHFAIVFICSSFLTFHPLIDNHNISDAVVLIHSLAEIKRCCLKVKRCT